jgi:hypothetical protein
LSPSIDLLDEELSMSVIKVAGVDEAANHQKKGLKRPLEKLPQQVRGMLV